jgi:hypothetical protein
MTTGRINQIANLGETPSIKKITDRIEKLSERRGDQP